MKPSMLIKLDQLVERLAELNNLLAQATAVSNLDNFRKMTREHAELSPLIELYNNYTQAANDIIVAQDLLSDPEMKIFAQDEINIARTSMELLEIDLQKMLVPKDPDNDRSVFLEIRAGTGGDESALFAGNLLRMYMRFAERKGWEVDIISASESGIGGYKEIILRISGINVYSQLKFESGGHRVQRVPATETQGRIHTSACTVAVMPEVDGVENIDIISSDIRIDTFRASGAGGQHINTTDSAVRVTHIPTGIVVECQNDRSQHKNKASALKVLTARIKDMQLREQQSKKATTRKSLIGSGDRSERIRTYNFPQGRMTDHRTNLTLYKLNYIMDGDLGELTNALISEHQAELLAQLTIDK